MGDLPWHLILVHPTTYNLPNHSGVIPEPDISNHVGTGLVLGGDEMHAFKVFTFERRQ